ncbi:MAG: LysR family transcriptional regulator [Acidimicrobiales bacterium]
MPDIEPRLLRHFVAVANELHFGRAAARLYIAQQALSRDVARLEKTLGVQLFVRSTRRVALTPEGERLLPRARQLLALHDELRDDIRDTDRPLLVDVVRPGSTAARVLALARTLVAATDLEARFHGGFGAALGSLLARRIDVAFGRSTGAELSADLTRRLVRFEPVGLLLLEDHPLARDPVVPLDAITGLTVDTGGGNVAAPEWVDLGRELVTEHGGEVAPDHHPGMEAVASAPAEETAHHMRTTGWPILTFTTVTDVPGAVIRPLVEPVPIYPWTMVHRRNVRTAELDALGRAVDELAAEEGWHRIPNGAWIADGDRELLRDSR